VFNAHKLNITWTAEEISLASDVADFAKADEREKDYITNVMRLTVAA